MLSIPNASFPYSERRIIMTNFANAVRKESHLSTTENGQVCYNTTENKCMDLFATIGALRSRDETSIETLFDYAYREDPLTAIKLAFYARDIRQGCGERRTFRIIIKYAANNYPEAVIPNICLFKEFGRFDDLYELIGTKCEDTMWAYMKSTFVYDLDCMSKNEPVTLLAKWIKTPDASSKETRKLGILTANKLGYSVYEFKRLLRKLRKYIDVTEVKMSAKHWSDIDYEAVPSRAAMIYRNAFKKHDEERYNEYINAVSEGTAKINSSTLYPYDIIEKYITPYGGLYKAVDPVLEEQWKALPNYVEGDANAIVISDVSGSMAGRPMATSVGLALYFAERNVGPFHDLCMVFSDDARVIELKGRSIPEKIVNMFSNIWYGSTNVRAAFEKILAIAVSNNIPSEEMVKSLIIISDMEFNHGCDDDSMVHAEMAKKFAEKGYTLPTIVYWNVNSRDDAFHVSYDTPNTILVSGQSTTTFKNIIGAIEFTPYELMRQVIDSKRYENIIIDKTCL